MSGTSVFITYRGQVPEVDWILLIHFHNKQHPVSIGDNEVKRYLEHLVLKQNVAPRTQSTALNSLSFLYKHIIKSELSLNLNFARSKKKQNCLS